MEETKNQQVEEKKETSSQKYAGFWLRLLAYLIDYVILIVASKIIFGDRIVTTTSNSVSAQFDGVFFLIPLLYFILFWKFFSATPGKMLLKMKIISEKNPDKLSWKDVILRYIGYFISGIVILLGFIWIGFDKKKQGWHDKIAKTFVVKK